MSENRIDEIIFNIESIRKSKVLAYITSDREPPLKAKIALDILPIFYDHLRKIKNTKRIDLFIYSTGGDIITPWRLVNLIREFTNEFNVLIPYKAHSAATMIALGANEIIMGPLGELSPIDPNIGTPFNPPHPEIPNEPKVDISVEDVFGYINLAKEKLEISDQTNIINYLLKLIEKIHPLAIGAVYRTHSLIRLLATKLLLLHMKDKDEHFIQKIVEDLIEKLYYHGYLISRNEAKTLGLKIVTPSKELEENLWKLYKIYAEHMGLGKPFNALEMIPEDQNSHKLTVTIAYISSKGFHSKFLKTLHLKKLPPSQIGATPQIGIQESVHGWKNIS